MYVDYTYLETIGTTVYEIKQKVLHPRLHLKS